MVGDTYPELGYRAHDGANLEVESRTLCQKVLVVVHLPEVLLGGTRIVAFVVFGIVERYFLVYVPESEIESEVEDVVDVETARDVVFAYRAAAFVAHRRGDVAVFGQPVQSVHVVAAQTGEEARLVSQHRTPFVYVDVAVIERVVVEGFFGKAVPGTRIEEVVKTVELELEDVQQ